MNKEIAKQLLIEAGINPSDDDLEMTLSLHEALSGQLAKALPKTLETVEPHFIQPTRPEST